jgi:hypothetical protein
MVGGATTVFRIFRSPSFARIRALREIHGKIGSLSPRISRMDADIPIYRRAEIFTPLCAKALRRKPGQKSAG